VDHPIAFTTTHRNVDNEDVVQSKSVSVSWCYLANANDFPKSFSNFIEKKEGGNTDDIKPHVV
jgi:hypothetical protein